MTYVPWFRETLKESKRQWRLAKTLESKACWLEAIFRIKKILSKKIFVCKIIYIKLIFLGKISQLERKKKSSAIYNRT